MLTPVDSPAEEWAEKCNRATNDTDRIEKRKLIAPAFTVPRHRPIRGG